jgi:hypothetical protein
MSEVTKVPALESGERPETGPMQFGDDWPGVFIRGDNALFDARAVEAAITFVPAERWDVRAMLIGLAQTLHSCSVGDTGWPPAPPVEQAKTDLDQG